MNDDRDDLLGKFYMHVAGVDYRTVEYRNRAPSQSYSLVVDQMAGEVCRQVVMRDGKGSLEKRRLITGGTSDDTWAIKPANFRRTLERAYLTLYTRPLPSDDSEEYKELRALFDSVSAKNGAARGWRAVCHTLLASSEFVLY